MSYYEEEEPTANKKRSHSNQIPEQHCRTTILVHAVLSDLVSILQTAHIWANTGVVFRKLSCWVQSVDRRYPWICLRNLWIHTLRRNPWIAQISVDRATRSMNFAYDTILLTQTYMDGLVISTNLKLNNFTHFNGPLQSTEQNHRPSASERLHGRRSRQVPAVILLILLLLRTSASHRTDTWGIVDQTYIMQTVQKYYN